MSSAINNYMNKDFQSIYPELLELTKKLASNWDPTISNEADPGVVLIKLNAILADKNNYMIDKNILECFPETVSQDGNASHLFNQLGYHMSGYKSATGQLSFLWDSDTQSIDGTVLTVNIPAFTMFSDEPKEIVYTLTEGVSLPLDNATVEVRGNCIQGVVRDYEVYGTTRITTSNLDSENRLYFPIKNVAENGIFIAPYQVDGQGVASFVYDDNSTPLPNGEDSPNYWKLVDNLNAQPVGTKCYKFGVSQDDNTPYIEFPSDVEYLFDGGIQIKYIQTDGAGGNCRSAHISQFYNSFSITVDNNPLSISDSTLVLNVGPMLNGANPEKIEDAYKSYQRTVGTFDTLVTLRDYLNYILNDDTQHIVSNGVVADRTTDIQSSYKVTSVDEYFNRTTLNKVVGTQGQGVEMSPYDLRTYFLSYSPICENIKIEDFDLRELKRYYDDSFEFVFGGDKKPMGTPDGVEQIFNGVKSLQHNFIEKAFGDGNDVRPLFIKNRVDLHLDIVPYGFVSASQADELEVLVKKTLYKELSSNRVKFGEEPLYETIYDICCSASDKIKAVALDPLEFTSYVVYYDGETIKETQLPTLRDLANNPSGSYSAEAIQVAQDVLAKSILNGSTPLYLEGIKVPYSIQNRNIDLYEEVTSVGTYMSVDFCDNTSGNANAMNPEGEGVERTLGDNEYITFYSPKLTTVSTFGSATKYVYFTTEEYRGSNPTIPENVDYELEKGQYLFLFGKEEDSSTAPYWYEKFSAGDIINSMVRLTRVNGKKDALISHLSSSTYGGKTGTIANAALHQLITDITDTILTTTRTLSYKSYADVELKNATKYCCWTTNDVSEDGTENTISFTVRPTDTTDVVSVYQDSMMYVSNFKVEVPTDGPTAIEHTLRGTERLVILRVIPKTIDYTSYRLGGGTTVCSALVHDFKCVDVITKGATIRTTGGIYTDATKYGHDKDGNIVTSSALTVDGVVDTLAGHLSTIEKGDLITYGGIDTSKTPAQIQYGLIPHLLSSAKDIYCLELGNRIEVVGTPPTADPEFVYFDYVLKHNEQFYYTNEAMDSLEILGTGSRISIKVSGNDVRLEDRHEVTNNIKPIEFTCKRIPVATSEVRLIKEGYWKKVSELLGWPNNANATKPMFTVNECNTVMLGPGSCINVRKAGESVTYRIPEGTSNTVNFISSTAHQVVLPLGNYNGLMICTDGIATSEDTHSFEFTPSPLRYFDIRYKSSSTSDAGYETLPRTMQSKLAWYGWASLALNLSSTREQALIKEHYHQVTIRHKTGGGPAVTRITMSDEDEDIKYMSCTEGFHMHGSEYMDLSGVDINDDLYYPNISIYSKVAPWSSEPGVPMAIGLDTQQNSAHHISVTTGESNDRPYYNIIFNLGGDDESNSALHISGSIIQGPISFKYLVPIVCDKDIYGHNISVMMRAGSNQPTTGGISGVGPYGALLHRDVIPAHKMFYVLIDNHLQGYNGADSFTIKIDMSGVPDGAKFRVYEPTVVVGHLTDKEYSALDDSEFLTVLGVIKSLNEDLDFDFSNIPEPQYEVADPLKPKSFFSPYHPYNKFVIPQISSIEARTVNRR